MAEYLVAFASTHAALAFESAFGSEAGLVPVPPAVRAGCGMGLRFFEEGDAVACARVADLSRSLDLEAGVEGVYRRRGSDYTPV